jgi:hypothetical protein
MLASDSETTPSETVKCVQEVLAEKKMFSEAVFNCNTWSRHKPKPKPKESYSEIIENLDPETEFNWNILNFGIAIGGLAGGVLGSFPILFGIKHLILKNHNNNPPMGVVLDEPPVVTIHY